jgi:hypothetical protein
MTAYGTLTVGEKYDASTYRTSAEIARLVRKDLKAAQAAGEIPGKDEGFTYRVTSKRYSMGQSVAIHIVGPDTRGSRGEDWARRDSEPGDRNYGRSIGEWEWTEQALTLSPIVDAIGQAYVRSDIDSMTDYFNVSCYVQTYIGHDGLCAPRGF